MMDRQPGSGKSTLAYPLTDRINSLLLHHPVSHPSTLDERDYIAEPGRGDGQGDEIAICVGLDGWHLTRATLDTFSNPDRAHWERVRIYIPRFQSSTETNQGAEYTFDQSSYRAFLTKLRMPLNNSPDHILFPSFDHAVKDPTPSPTPITHRHRIVLIEGLYTMLDIDDWRECAAMMDMRLFVEVDREISRSRVIRRNFDAGIVDNLEKCAVRGESSQHSRTWPQANDLQSTLSIWSTESLSTRIDISQQTSSIRLMSQISSREVRPQQLR